MSVIALFGLGGAEILLIFTIVLVLWTAKRFPGIGAGFGRGVQEFLKATRELLGSNGEPPSTRKFGPPALMALTFLLGVACLILMVYELSK